MTGQGSRSIRRWAARALCGPVAVLILLAASPARGDDAGLCAVFRVVLSEAPESAPDGVFLRKTRIGWVIWPGRNGTSPNEFDLCVDRTHAKHFREKTMCYVSGEKLIIYNFWSTNKALKEGDEIRGFSSKFRLFLHEMGLFADRLRG